ncbi:MAG: GGDEF domain-containing protein [Sedimentisphaerales bacterium]|nr:GGDEF domain-containing protein [Sedimentisphaerales bacterium]
MTTADKPKNGNDRDPLPYAETDGDRLRGIVSPVALSVDLVSALAGDRTPTEVEQRLLASMRIHRGQRFFSDVLYALTHQYFAPEIAEKMWHSILQHKYEISETLKRNVRIIVAALDYLSNLTTNIQLPTLIGEHHISKIVELSMHDGLTGLLNHTTCHEIILVELKNYARHGTVISLILLDIDDFRLANDQSGHLGGDRILAELAASLKKTVRDSDVCCRYGGDEFAVLMPFTNIQIAGEIAERIRSAATEVRFGDRTLTVSIGVASCSSDMTSAEALIKKADRALYSAKKDGKNCVRIEA